MTMHDVQRYSARAFGARARKAFDAIRKDFRQRNLPVPNQLWLAGQVGRYGPAAGQDSISRWLRGDVVPARQSVVALARVLRVTPGWLCFGEDGCAEVSAGE